MVWNKGWDSFFFNLLSWFCTIWKDCSFFLFFFENNWPFNVNLFLILHSVPLTYTYFSINSLP
jgi:hypothetical protein